jgi:hypothetical protein
MISVIIPTLDAEAALAQALAALVPAALDGLVREAIVVDGGSRDRTAEIADEAGATFVTRGGGRGCQLAAGAAQARFPWLLFLHADTALDPGWEREAVAFMEAVDTGRRPPAAAAFRFALDDRGLRPRLLERLVALRCALLRLPYGDPHLAAADPRGHQRGTVPPRRLRPPIAPQPRVPRPVLPARAAERDRARVRLSPARHGHHMSVRRALPAWRRRLPMRSG